MGRTFEISRYGVFSSKREWLSVGEKSFKLVSKDDTKSEIEFDDVKKVIIFYNTGNILIKSRIKFKNIRFQLVERKFINIHLIASIWTLILISVLIFYFKSGLKPFAGSTIISLLPWSIMLFVIGRIIKSRRRVDKTWEELIGQIEDRPEKKLDIKYKSIPFF